MSNETGRPSRALFAQISDVTRSSEYAAPEQRMVALRRVLHESSVGLTKDEVLSLLARVEARYPDRIYQASAQASELEKRERALREEVASLRTDVEMLRNRVTGLEEIARRVVDAVGRAAHRESPGTAAPSASVTDPASLGPLFDVVGLLVEFAVDQERIVLEFEAGMDKKRSDATTNLQETLRQLHGGGLFASDVVDSVRRRLAHLGRFPTALISGVQQSWRSGTTSILKSLDPTTDKLTVLRARALLEEQRTKFKSFWDQFDRNISHYYRATFERVYSENMEDRR